VTGVQTCALPIFNLNIFGTTRCVMAEKEPAKA